MSDTGAEGAAQSTLDPEDRARANLYGVIGRLFYAPADSNLLAEISRGGQGGEGQERGSGLVAAWRGVQESCRNAYPVVVRQEYDSLFIGVGRAQVSPYLSGYAEPMAPDRFLVRLRDQLSALGLGRRESVFEVEDHVSGISDVMRWLIENGHSLDEQKRFFENFAYPGVLPLCVAVQNAPSASFYKQVAALTWSFFEIEKTAFEMSATE
jgi:TorA maturation chaperone TorD